MGLNTDFCFADANGTLVVAGWSSEQSLDLELYADDTRFKPEIVTRHTRRDLRSAEPMGFLAIFNLSAVDNSVDGTLHLKTGHEFSEITPERLITDEMRLIEIGVDEAFFAYLRVLATGRLNLPIGEVAQAAANRLRFAPLLPRESEDFALGVDRGVVTADGQGIVSGWYLGASGLREPLRALAIDENQICSIDLLANSLPREDLQAYSPRYRYSGMDGFCGAFVLPNPARGPLKLLLIIPGQDAAAGVVVVADPVQPAELASAISEAGQALPDPALQRRFRGAMLGSLAPWKAPQDAPLSRAGKVSLVLDHDLADSDLRDILRRIGAAVARPVDLFLLRSTLTAELSEAIGGASREMEHGLQLQGVAMQFEPASHAGDFLLFGRSSTFFLLEPEDMVFDAAADRQPVHVTVLDPIGSLTGEQSPSPERFARDLLPFAISGPTSTLLSLLELAPREFLTEEARLRYLAERLMQSGGASSNGVDSTLHFSGKSGPFSQNLPGGLDWHGFDAESRKLMEARTPV
ncbi:hypothetical protein RGQ15_01210 [Paracoccus sp. MBLB3053]|uniref:Uncharacterized protein n=1 Tax=Paracoccus aurantius TaxID=3073814 RepID=A0ABU2HME2_9RHOB|nr:hypothetical protein [Paracoccus sp. MBLB3053]MDS9466198.1 hypothetical protein [Paracoccus sp. MBLB3053]